MIRRLKFIQVGIGPKDAINIAISLDWLEYSEDFDPGEIVTCSEIITFVQGVFQWAEIQS